MIFPVYIIFTYSLDTFYLDLFKTLWLNDFKKEKYNIWENLLGFEVANLSLQLLGVLNNEKIKAINKKIGQNKAQYNLDRQTAKSSALLSENVSKYEFLTGRDVYLKNMLVKPVALKRFEYSPLRKELKAQAYIANKQYQKLGDIDEF